MGIGRDITDRRTSEQQLAAQAAEMKDLIVTKDKFFSIIAHDLRGPLGSFMSLTRVMSEELNEMSLSRIQEISLALSKSSARLFDMLENLLEWSRMQRGLVAFEPEAIPLDCWLAGIVHAFGEQARAKGIIIQTVVEPGLEMTADNRMMESTLRNLISNAIKFTNTGGKVWVSAHAGSGGGRIITVRDSGIGMDEEMLSRLFRIDVNAGRPGTDGESSSGLGLLLCKEFVERHGGTILVSSDPGKGTSFSVELPEMPTVTG
jgi:signal transduction histidine kinase